MVLSFLTQINGNPTYFIDKIWVGLALNNVVNAWSLNPFLQKYRVKFGKTFDQMNRPLSDNFIGKIHTIREDKANRWKPGIMIDFFINTRKENMFRFAPKIPVISVQDFEISYFTDAPYCYNMPIVTVDGKYISKENLLILSRNDGFESVEDFLKYFNQDFKGKIIHWTHFNYE